MDADIQELLTKIDSTAKEIGRLQDILKPLESRLREIQYACEHKYKPMPWVYWSDMDCIKCGRRS